MWGIKKEIDVPVKNVVDIAGNSTIKPELTPYINGNVLTEREKYWNGKDRLQGGQSYQLFGGDPTILEDNMLDEIANQGIVTLIVLYNDNFSDNEQAAIKYVEPEQASRTSLVLKIMFWVIAVFLVGLIVYVVVKIIRIEQSDRRKSKTKIEPIIIKRRTSKYL